MEVPKVPKLFTIHKMRCSTSLEVRGAQVLKVFESNLSPSEDLERSKRVVKALLTISGHLHKFQTLNTRNFFGKKLAQSHLLSILAKSLVTVVK